MSLRQTLSHLPRDTRDTLFLLFVIAWVIAPHAGHLPGWASAVAVGLLGWRAWLAWHSRPLPGRWTLLVLLTAAVAGTLWTHGTILGRDAGVTLIVMLLAFKTLEVRARRDAMVVFFLGFFTMLSNFFFSQSLGVAAAMLVALLGLLTALVNAHMPVGRPPLVQAMRTAGTMALLGAPIMAALFLFFPRLAPLWGVPSDAMTGRSGLSGSMQVGTIAQLALDDKVALRVRFGPPGTEVPPRTALYFRGPVLGDFDGVEWRPLTYREDFRRGDAALAMAQLQVQGPALRYEVTLEPHQRPWLLVLDAAARRPEGPGLQPLMTPDLQWLSQHAITDVTRYSAESHLEFRHGPQAMTASLRAYTELPPGFNPRTLALAQSLRNDRSLVPDPSRDASPALVNAALERLRTGGYRYTLEPGVYGRDTADEFWFDRKQGFCEHIASSFVILMRALDIPARIVTGYQGGELNSVDGYWTVRQSDAHAWAEVWLPGQGWVRVDPTSAISPGRIGEALRLQAPRGALGTAMDTMLSPGTLAQMRAVWEAANNRWNQWVLNYTQGRQLDLMRSLGFESPGWEDLIRVLGALVLAAALLGVGWNLWDRAQHDPWMRLLTRVHQRLARSGLAVPPHLPPRATAVQVRAFFGPAGEPLAQWLLALEQTRYAPHPTQGLPALRRSLRSLAWPQRPGT
ncbi:MAG: transglutaminaseTgpA domain-containing protein [Burkholderiaceae bacterium]